MDGTSLSCPVFIKNFLHFLWLFLKLFARLNKNLVIISFPFLNDQILASYLIEADGNGVDPAVPLQSVAESLGCIDAKSLALDLCNHIVSRLVAWAALGNSSSPLRKFLAFLNKRYKPTFSNAFPVGPYQTHHCAFPGKCQNF